MVVQLLLYELVQFHFLNVFFSQLFILIELFRVFVSERIAWNVQIGQKPIIQFLIPNHFIVDHFDVLSGHKVVNDKILEFEFFLEDSPSFLKSLDFLGIHFLELLVLVF